MLSFMSSQGHLKAVYFCIPAEGGNTTFSPLFVGIDVSSENHVVCCLTRADNKRPVGRFTVTDNRSDILEFREGIAKLTKQQQPEEICSVTQPIPPCTSSVTWTLAFRLPCTSSTPALPGSLRSPIT